MSEINGVKAAIDTVRELLEPALLDIEGHGVKTQVLVIGDKMHDLAPVFEAERARQAEPPLRTKGNAVAETLESFCALVNHHSTSLTRIFASGGLAPSLSAVVDYHESGRDNESPTNWCGHTIGYSFPKTDSLQAWLDATKTFKPQQEFAKWLAGRLLDMAYPEELGELNQDSIVAKVMRSVYPGLEEAVQLKRTYASYQGISELIQSMGARVSGSYKETETDAWGNTKLVHENEQRIESKTNIPQYFLISIAPFKGSPELALPVRLYAQIADGKVQLRCELIGLDRVVESAFVDALAEVEKATGIKPFRGTPEK